MESIELSRTIDADPPAVQAAIDDLEPFMRAAGFDTVTVEGDRLDIAKTLGLLKVSLSLRIVEDEETALTYEQIDGMFESMITEYTLQETEDGTEVTVRTEFGLDAPGGSLLDSTVIKRQRRKELTGQFDYLEDRLADR